MLNLSLSPFIGFLFFSHSLTRNDEERRNLEREFHILNPSSPNPNFFPKLKSSPISSYQKQKSSKENTDPNGLSDVRSSPAMAKIKSNLPPRPRSSNLNPLKRKLVMDSVPEHSVLGSSSDYGVKPLRKLLIDHPPRTGEVEELLHSTSFPVALEPPS
ncbi:hypothetical protein GIB67_022920 [Kingdonia uniflora]|uniref:Uncharacterized protein n=1 Tax=Kingdonia uniflora TaxID=39325 RepID=A0A7J7P2F3_9MAGN|nr:hypothetical protein GIB67_022920 [Kingdonia uniflora]